MNEKKDKKVKLKDIFTSLSLKSEECSNQDTSELFHLFYEGHFGPLKRSDIQNIIDSDADLETNNTLVRNIKEEDWSPLFEHPFFQRRTDEGQQTSPEKSKSNDFHLLKHGRKIGPFTTEQIKNKIENGEMTITDMISADDGETWGKIFELKGFDRRKLHINQELPTTPELSIFEGVEDEVAKDLRKASKNKMTDTIASLAHFGNLENKKQYTSLFKQKSKNFMTPKNGAILLASCLGLSTIILAIVVDFTPAPILSPSPTPQQAARSSLRTRLGGKEKNKTRSPKTPAKKSISEGLRSSTPTTPRPSLPRRNSAIEKRQRQRSAEDPPEISSGEQENSSLLRRRNNYRNNRRTDYDDDMGRNRRDYDDDIGRNRRDFYDDSGRTNFAPRNRRRRTRVLDLDRRDLPEDLEYEFIPRNIEDEYGAEE